MNAKTCNLHGFYLEFETFEDGQMYIKEFMKINLYHNTLLPHLFH